MASLDLTCSACGVVAEPDLGWQVFTNGTSHLRAECRACGAYIKYLKQFDEMGEPTTWLLMAPVRPF